MCPSWGQYLVSERSFVDWLSAHLPALAIKKGARISHVARYPRPLGVTCMPTYSLDHAELSENRNASIRASPVRLNGVTAWTRKGGIIALPVINAQ